MSNKQTRPRPTKLPRKLRTPIAPARRLTALELGAQRVANPSATGHMAPGEMGRVAVEFQEKLLLLFDLFGIDQTSEDRWVQLSMRLVVEYIPGFSVAESSPDGRKEIWDDQRLAKLWYEATEIQQQRTAAAVIRSDVDACRLLARAGGARTTGEVERRAKTLVNRLAKARSSPLVRMLSEARARAAGTTAAAETDERMRRFLKLPPR